ncbi:MAG: hypothetical protein ACKOCN_01375 [Planctomycetaceae bacterium]
MPRLVLDSTAVGATGVGGRRRLSFRIAGQDLPESIWVEVAERDADLLAEDGDWALVAMLYPAMRMGMDLHVDAPVSPRLLDALTRDLQPFLSVYEPRLRPIAVTASATSVDASHGTLTATGFSAGIDSFATLARYRFGDVHPSLRLKALTVFDVGAFGRCSEPLLFKGGFESRDLRRCPWNAGDRCRDEPRRGLPRFARRPPRIRADEHSPQRRCRALAAKGCRSLLHLFDLCSRRDRSEAFL